MKLRTESYLEQKKVWPVSGRHILAQYDQETMIVYQAFKPTIGQFAAAHGYFGVGFSMDRTSWIKPNFLWMMYRSSWGTAPQQEVVLAVRLKRAAFDWILAQAIHSKYYSGLYSSDTAWKAQLNRAPVVLQWDPDHTPSGQKVERRALQLGLRGEALNRYAREWIVDIEDVSEFVAEQRVYVQAKELERLMMPSENVYPVSDSAVRASLLLSEYA